MPTFGERFRQLRIEKGLKQEELINEFNKVFHFSFTKSAISQYENDKRIPEIQALSAFADYYNVSMDYLLGKTDERNVDTNRLSKANSLKDELIELMIKRGIIKDKNNINDEHLKLIEMSISTYADKTNNKKQGDEN